MPRPDLPTDVLNSILWLASPRSACYTQRGRQALISLCLTFHDIIDLNARIPFTELWFSKAGKLKLSLNLKEREYMPDARRNTPKNHARFEPAYKFILKYSARWERIHFDKDKFVFKNLLHFGAKSTGRYIESVLPLHEMPKLKSLAVQGRGEFVQFRVRFFGVWDKLRQIELGIFASITVHLRILQECCNLEEFTLRGDTTFWYMDRGEFDEDVMLTEAARHDIVLRKVHTASFLGFVYTNAILNTLTLPSLSTFTIIKPSACTGTSDLAEQDTDLAVSDLVNCSQCNLQKLELCCIAINNERAIKLLKGLPSLSKLYLEAADIDCTFLLSLKDELHLLKTLQLKVISSDPKAHADEIGAAELRNTHTKHQPQPVCKPCVVTRCESQAAQKSKCEFVGVIE
ncbi:hypothetical protein H1R20_g9739, partial [Candolleomyces eurysporus]